MKQRFGGLLALALGTVLIVNGVSAGSDGAVGSVGLPSNACGAPRQPVTVGIPSVDQCPTGSINITETSGVGVTPPTAGWTVKVTSGNCYDPLTNALVDRTVVVPDGMSLSVQPLYIFQASGASVDSAKCTYALAEDAVAGVTATFTPTSPVTIGFDDNDFSKRTVAVALANAAAAASSTPATSTPPSATLEPSETGSGPTTDFTDPAVSASAGAGDAGAGSSSSAAPIAETGPSQPITASLWLGIGLLFLGLFLLFEGRIRTLGRHRS